MQTTLSHYRLDKRIGAGGIGVVYRARDERLDRDVALKILAPGTLSNESARKTFRKEALALSRLNHPNIATVFDFDSEGETDFLITEYIPGLSLDAMVSAGPLPEKEILDLGMQLAEGMHAAHEHGVIHCDLKPANLRVTPDARLKILDFGLARVTRLRVDPDTVTETVTAGNSGGTPPYMAPEQLMGERVDARTDIWGIGCVLYEMATGRRPFFGTGAALTDTILHQAPVPPSKLNDQVSWKLDEIVLKCLEKDPELRYQSAREIAVDLHRLTSPSVARDWRQVPRVRVNIAYLALVVAVGLVGVGVLWWGRNHSRAPQSVQPTIAVLPFADISEEKQEYFSDGLSEELLNALAKIPGLRVAARTSSFQFKGKNPQLAEIGHDLNVATVLEGSVRKEGRRVRISAELVNVSDGFQLWSETYDRELNDILSVQSEIARAVATSLKLTLLGDNKPQHARADAYAAYLEARYFRQRRSKEDLERSIEYYEKAIQLDPAYTLAWAGLAQARAFQATISYLPFEVACDKARKAAQRAMSQNADLAEVQSAMAVIKAKCDWDWSAADTFSQRAAALEPGNVSVLAAAAQLQATMGRFADAVAIEKDVVERDPLNSAAYVDLGTDSYYWGRLEDAVAAFKKALELNPNNPAVHYSLARVYLAESRPQEALSEVGLEMAPGWRLQGLALTHFALGNKSESDQALAELTAKFHRDMAFQIAEVHAFRGKGDQAFEWLERAYRQRDAGLSGIKNDPLLKNIEHDARYAALLKQMHLPV